MSNLVKAHQQDLFQVHNTFFVFISALIYDGTAAKIQKRCSSSLAVLCALKAAADYQTGLASVGVSLLAKQSGCSRGTALKAVDALADEGLIKKVKTEKGQRHIYQLFDKLAVRQEDKLTGQLSVPYQPRQIRERLEDIGRFRQNGELPARALAAGTTYNIQINIHNHYHDGRGPYERTASIEESLGQLRELKANNPMKRLAVEALRKQVERLENELTTDA